MSRRPSRSRSTHGRRSRISNPIVRVTAPVHLVKTYTGPQGVIDPARTYPVTLDVHVQRRRGRQRHRGRRRRPNGVKVADAVP